MLRPVKYLRVLARGLGCTVTAVGLVYWGRGGGGFRTLQIFAQSLLESGYSVVASVSSRNRDLGPIPSGSWTGDGVPVVSVSTPARRAELLLPSSARDYAISETLIAFRDFGVSRLVIVMPHPWDMALLSRSRPLGLTTTVVIHDPKAHRGELWPTRSTALRRILVAHHTLFLSHYVRNHFADHWFSHSVALLPEISTPFDVGARKGLLFVGRLKAYKGMGLLRDSWSLAHKLVGSLTIAGWGRAPSGSWPGDVSIINRWLTHQEVEYLIASAQAVVLPYQDASQSGVIPLAQALGTPVACTAVGGLPEQLLDWEAGSVANRLTPQALARAIKEAVSQEAEPVDFSYRRMNLAHSLVVNQGA